jgi:hypothetical protein
MVLLKVLKINNKSKKIKGEKEKEIYNSQFICSLFNCSKKYPYLRE